MPSSLRYIMKASRIQVVGWGANQVSAASQVGSWKIGVAALLAALACSAPPDAQRPYTVAEGDSPSGAERYCAWYGDARGDVLYFGAAPFWSAFRAHGDDPRGDLAARGPQPIGRFDLRRGRLLEPLEVGEPASRSGVWDVLAHPNGRVYFTTYFEAMGSVDPASGEVRRFEALGPGLNELAAGPDGALLVSRYGVTDGAPGAVVVFSPDGEPIDEFPLSAPSGFRAAPKTLAFDPNRGEIWATTDLLPDADAAIRHDTYVLDRRGRELRRIERPEVQFVAFAADGTGYRAELDGARLELVVVSPDGSSERILLDDGFVASHDFVQDIQPAPDGRVVVTRWSGWLHVIGDAPTPRALRLPALEPDGLYYSGVVSDGRVCATYCAGIHVVCRDIR
jgi:hypothetical protein